jgi:DNA-binding transcriptional MocR family regulator
MYDAWSEPTSWSETCQRSSGRRGYNKRRQIVAAVRRQIISKHVRQVGLRRGVRAELSRMLQVSKSTICQDMRRLLARSEGRSVPAWSAGTRDQGPAGRRGRRRKVHMSEKLSLRLSPALYDDLQHAARRRHTTPSAVVRLALQQVLEQSMPTSTPSTPPPVTPGSYYSPAARPRCRRGSARRSTAPACPWRMC